jgi:hypothetical protein
VLTPHRLCTLALRMILRRDAHDTLAAIAVLPVLRARSRTRLARNLPNERNGKAYFCRPAWFGFAAVAAERAAGAGGDRADHPKNSLRSNTVRLGPFYLLTRTKQ